MAMLPSPLIPDARQWIDAYDTGYNRGEAMRKRNLLLEAGQLAAAGGGQQPIQPMVQPSQGAGGGMGAYSNAISSVESGGRYDAIGPATRTGDRAYGKYQVMGANIPSWTKKHLGREMTPQQFLADKDAQEQVFKGEFGGYVAKYGNPQDAASMWFTGKPAAQGAGRNDGYTSQPEYLRRFNAALGGRGAPAQAPAQAAPAADPNASLRNASNALLRGGELQAGLGIQNQLFERSEKARAEASAKQKEMQGIIGELALRADTPEKWARAVGAARAGGLDVTGLDDFSARDLVLARTGKSMDYMSSGKRVFNKTTGQYVPLDPNAPTDVNDADFSKNPVYGVDAQGNTVILQLNDQGGAGLTKLPEGVRVGKDPIRIDAGTETVLLDPVTRQRIGSIPKDVAGEAAQKATGQGLAERQLNKPAAEAAVKSSVSGLRLLANEALALKNEPGLSSATGVIQGSGLVPTVRQSTADAEARLGTLKSKIAFGVLQAMRDASKTGGALGAVSEKELALLENNLASLDLKQSESAFKASLDAILKYTDEAGQRLLQGYQATYGPGASSVAPLPPGSAAAPSARPRATNPQTGEAVEYNAESGQWERAQ